MKKVLSFIVLTLIICAMANTKDVTAATYNITPKAPKVSAGLQPIVVKYRNGDYVGSMQDLEELVKVEKNNTYAKYYLALCYTRLGYKEEAKSIYREVLIKDENLALSYYSQRALDCIEDPNHPTCKPPEKEMPEKQTAAETDMDLFIQSGKKIHPTAMDKITKQRMDIKLQEEEYIRTQKMQEEAMNGQLQSYNQPTNEEIASALNTLSKIGVNPFNNQNNVLMSAQQFNQLGAMGLNPNAYSVLMGSSNQEAARAFLYNQMNQQQNILNYGI